MTAWGDVNARARGLATRFPGRAALETLARSDDLRALGLRLRDRGARPREQVEEGTPHAASGAALERAVRASLAARLVILLRWLGPRADRLTPLLDDEDRRSLRALLRGAAEGAPPPSRLAGLIPTPRLPEPLLGRAAVAGSPREAERILHEAGHPLVAAPDPGLGGLPAELFDAEVEINRRFALRAEAMAARGGRLVRRFARETIDLENAWTALLWPPGPGPDRERLFLPGGERLDRARFERTVEQEAAGARRRLLAEAFAGSPLGPVFGDEAAAAGPAEARALALRITAYERRARLEPLSVAPLLVFFLRLRAEAMDLQRVAWGVALRAPVSVVGSAWASA